MRRRNASKLCRFAGHRLVQAQVEHLRDRKLREKGDR